MLFIVICILGRPRGPDAGSFMEIATERTSRHHSSLEVEHWKKGGCPEISLQEGKKGRDSPKSKEVTESYRRKLDSNLCLTQP